MIRHLILATALLGLAATSSAWAHGGGLDRYGCHHDRKHGGYHCHRGPLAGQSFSSQEDMLKRLNSPEAKGGNKKQMPKTSPR